jgi:hypothetical protein
MRWFLLAALALALAGCQSMLHPKHVKENPDIQSRVPTGEDSPFGPPPGSQ